MIYYIQEEENFISQIKEEEQKDNEGVHAIIILFEPNPILLDMKKDLILEMGISAINKKVNTYLKIEKEHGKKLELEHYLKLIIQKNSKKLNLCEQDVYHRFSMDILFYFDIFIEDLCCSMFFIRQQE